MSESFETLITLLEDQILTITLNRSKKLNALNTQMTKDLNDALINADNNDDVRVIIVTGSGKAFCAGLDLELGGDSFNVNKRDGIEDKKEPREGGGVLSLNILNLKKPIIAAINGAAVGIGATMTLPFDIRIASDKAKFGFVFSKRGITMEACSSFFLPRIVGINTAAQWVYSGKFVSPEEALAAGLISEITTPEDLLTAAKNIAKEFIENTSAVSIALCRQLMWRGLISNDPYEAHLIESKCLFYMGQQADVIEGVQSFLEKHDPNFPMKVSKDMPDFYPWWEDK